MSVLFNHARRYELFDGNPIHLVRQSAKRRTIPHILSIDEIQLLLGAVGALARILIFIDATTGLRQSELFGLRWKDLAFYSGEINVVRSVVHGVISNCKTESSMKPIPMSPYLADMLKQWKRATRYAAPDDWVFASVRTQGKRPLWGQSLMRKNIRPVAKRLGIDKNRLAHIPALVFNPASFPGHRHKSSAGSAQAFVSAADVGHVHAICHASKACGPRRSHSTPDCERAEHLSCTCRNTLNSWGLPAKPGSLAGGVAPFCTYGENAIDS
jgi:integrase